MADGVRKARATAIVACVLSEAIDSMALRDTVLAKYGIIVKMSEKRHFNGFRLSPPLGVDSTRVPWPSSRRAIHALNVDYPEAKIEG